MANMYGVIPYDAEGDKENARAWADLVKKVAPFINPVNYVRAGRDLMQTPQDAELGLKKPFVGPPGPYDMAPGQQQAQPGAGASMPFATSEFNAGMPVPRGVGGQRGASGGWGPNGASGSWGAPAPNQPAPPKSKGGGGGGLPPAAAANAQPEAPKRQTIEEQFAPDEKALKDYNKMIDKFAGDKKLDLSPLIALTDSWTGSRLMQGYNRPMSGEERERVVIGMREDAMKKEADLRYKKSYLASMAEQDKTRKEIANAKNANDLEKAKIAAAGRVKPVDPGKVHDRLWKNNKGLATYVAQARFGNPANPKDKAYANKAQLIHQDAVDGAEALIEAGVHQDFEVAYQDAMKALIYEVDSNRRQPDAPQ